MYQHKSGAQKRKDRSTREKNEKENAKKQKTLFKFNFETKFSNSGENDKTQRSNNEETNDDQMRDNILLSNLAPGSSHENVVLPTSIPAEEKPIPEEAIDKGK